MYALYLLLNQDTALIYAHIFFFMHTEKLHRGSGLPIHQSLGKWFTKGTFFALHY